MGSEVSQEEAPFSWAIYYRLKNNYDALTFCLRVAVCNELEMIVNGEITYNSDMIAPPYAVRTEATYNCRFPYILVINPGYPG